MKFNKKVSRKSAHFFIEFQGDRGDSPYVPCIPCLFILKHIADIHAITIQIKKKTPPKPETLSVIEFTCKFKISFLIHRNIGLVQFKNTIDDNNCIITLNRQCMIFSL